MIGEHDNNPTMEKHEWINYPFQEGNANDALFWVKEHIPTKENLYSYCCCCFARNGGGCFDRHVIYNAKMNRKGIQLDKDDMPHYVLHKDPPESLPAPKAVKKLKQKRGF
jgi:hypothetical protein